MYSDKWMQAVIFEENYRYIAMGHIDGTPTTIEESLRVSLLVEFNCGGILLDKACVELELEHLHTGDLEETETAWVYTP